MAEPHLDHPGDISWFPRRGPRPVLGACPHVACDHHIQRVIAWGPDYDHYELVECSVPEQCNDQCRAWARGDAPHATTPWLQVELPVAAALARPPQGCTPKDGSR